MKGSFLLNKLRKSTRPKQTLVNYSAEEIAELNLIEISNYDFHPEQGIHEKKDEQIQQEVQVKEAPKNKFRRTLHRNNRSVELRVSVTQKMTESFMAGRKQSCSELNTDRVCVLKRKLPLATSNYLVINNRSQNLEDNYDEIDLKPYRPKPSITSRTYFHKREVFQNERYNLPYRLKNKTNKLYPIEQSYWKIYKI